MTRRVTLSTANCLLTPTAVTAVFKPVWDEGCDDVRIVDDDDCTSDRQIEICGDGLHGSDEHCDDKPDKGENSECLSNSIERP